MNWKLTLLAATLLFAGGCRHGEDEPRIAGQGGKVNLPPPALEGRTSLETAINRRYSVRRYSDHALSLPLLAQILWAAQGLTTDAVTGATRTAPSAGATYPLEVYLIAGNVTGLPPGLYRYSTKEHNLTPLRPGEHRSALAAAALQQDFITAAPASLILVADYARTTRRYGDRGQRYVHMEIGHVTQNIHLQATALGLGSVAVGAFYDDRVRALLATDYAPLMIVPIGYPK
jgi:SagB-type dehydrogenase family enzyme